MSKQSMTGFLAAVLSAATVVAAPTVTVDENWSQDPATSQVTVKYKLTGEAAIVTLDVLTNGVSIGAGNVSRVAGDVCCVVQPSASETKTIRWRPDHDWAGHVFTQGEISVEVVAWPLNNLPDYMAVNLSMPSMVRYYASAEAVPLGVTDRRYKGEYLLMRRIHAAGKEFVMGTCASEPFHNMTSCDVFTPLPETAHPVAFTKDFYIGVYELTRLQGFLGCGNVYSGDGHVTLMGVTWNFARGEGTWPGADPAATSLLGALRSRTGIAFDLPTEAQWEYACRAGTTSSCNNGREVSTSRYAKDGDQPMSELGWTPAKTGWQAGGHEVGLLQPNAWGLYDMHGNASEWCLDWVSADGLSGYAIDPFGLASGTMKAYRGGCAPYWPVQARSGARLGFPPTRGDYGNIRVVCPVTVTK